MKIASIIYLFWFLQTENPNLNQDIIYPKAAEVKMDNGERCEVMNEKQVLKAKGILLKYWKTNVTENAWESYNRQYMLYHSINMGTVVYINGVCLEKPAEFFQKTWCLGMATAKCYYNAFVDLKGKKVVSFKWNVY